MFSCYGHNAVPMQVGVGVIKNKVITVYPLFNEFALENRDQRKLITRPHVINKFQSSVALLKYFSLIGYELSSCDLQHTGRMLYFSIAQLRHNHSITKDLIQWLWVMTHVREVVGSNPGIVYWMDIWTFFHFDLLYKLFA